MIVDRSTKWSRAGFRAFSKQFTPEEIETARHWLERLGDPKHVTVIPGNHDAYVPGALAQTSIARLNGIVARADLGETLAYHLLADSASASYLWAVLTDAMAEFEGRPVGLAALSTISR